MERERERGKTRRAARSEEQAEWERKKAGERQSARRSKAMYAHVFSPEELKECEAYVASGGSNRRPQCLGNRQYPFFLPSAKEKYMIIAACTKDMCDVGHACAVCDEFVYSNGYEIQALSSLPQSFFSLLKFPEEGAEPLPATLRALYLIPGVPCLQDLLLSPRGMTSDEPPKVRMCTSCAKKEMWRTLLRCP